MDNQIDRMIFDDPKILGILGVEVATDMSNFFKHAFTPSDHESIDDRLGAIQGIMELYLGRAMPE